jgi:hypothetical protein
VTLLGGRLEGRSSHEPCLPCGATGQRRDRSLPRPTGLPDGRSWVNSSSMSELGIVCRRLTYLALPHFRLEKMARNLVNEIKELNQPHVHIKDAEQLNVKLNGIINDTFQQLQIVSDFDLTITKQHENGKRHLSSFRKFLQ